MAQQAEAARTLKVLLEMRPALDGYAGIPQETRLLFSGLCTLHAMEIEGLLQTSLRFLAPGMPIGRKFGAPNQERSRSQRYARVIESLIRKPPSKRWEIVHLYLKRRGTAYRLSLATLLFGSLGKVTTSLLETHQFEQPIWQALYSKTLHADDFALVMARGYRVCTVPWNILQSAGLNLLQWGLVPKYPVLDTQGVDVFITQTPYPARVGRHTALVVRYHDALPLLMPAMFANTARHHATHLYALKSNVESGAYFACVSESTREDLLRLFPEIGLRAVTIPNIVSPHYFPEESSPYQVPEIIRRRLNLVAPQAHPVFDTQHDQEAFYGRHLGAPPFQYLLMVATIEPRKNHARLVAALQVIRTSVAPGLKLVVVGSLGWDVAPILKEMRASIDQAAMFILSNVPASELRVLYRHAALTVCPSLAEGFDFPGVESMRCGGITLASNIAVHHEVYGEAAHYFEPGSTASLVAAITRVLYGPDSGALQSRMRVLGAEVSARYLPAAILPVWAAFLRRVCVTPPNGQPDAAASGHDKV